MDHIVGATHPPEYAIHKYWSRKPHNVLRPPDRDYLHAGSVFVDPFCGSGVALVEALRCGANAFGSDLNPVPLP